MLESCDAKEMLGYQHSGFSVDAGVCIEAHAPAKRSKAHYLWAVLIARTVEVFPLLCPLCGGQMRRRMRGRKSSQQTRRGVLPASTLPSVHQIPSSH